MVAAKCNGHRLAALAGSVPTPEVRHVGGFSEIDFDERWVRNIAENFPLRLAVPHRDDVRLIVDCYVWLFRDACGAPLFVRANAIGVRLRDGHCTTDLAGVDLRMDDGLCQWSQEQALATV
jgi:hypothetical protein